MKRILSTIGVVLSLVLLALLLVRLTVTSGSATGDTQEHARAIVAGEVPQQPTVSGFDLAKTPSLTDVFTIALETQLPLPEQTPLELLVYETPDLPMGSYTATPYPTPTDTVGSTMVTVIPTVTAEETAGSIPLATETATGLPTLVPTDIPGELPGSYVIPPTATLRVFLPVEGCVGGWSYGTYSEEPAQRSYLVSVSSTGPDDAWAVGVSLSGIGYGSLFQHWDGQYWKTVVGAHLSGELMLEDIVAISSNDAWAVGYRSYFASETSTSSEIAPIIEHWDGSSWSLAPAASQLDVSGFALFGVAASSANDVWMVGTAEWSRPLVLHWDGLTMSTSELPEIAELATLKEVRVLSPNDVWVVGEHGPYNSIKKGAIIAHWDGMNWSLSLPENPSSVRLSDVVALADNDVWAVGEKESDHISSLILHWNGVTWSQVDTPTSEQLETERLRSIVAENSGDIWAVGEQSMTKHEGIHSTSAFVPLLLHWDGTRWSKSPTIVPTSLGASLYAVCAIGARTILAVGEQLPGVPMIAQYTDGGCP